MKFQGLQTFYMELNFLAYKLRKYKA